jgi:hypothetical protein
MFTRDTITSFPLATARTPKTIGATYGRVGITEPRSIRAILARPIPGRRSFATVPSDDERTFRIGCAVCVRAES